jgi:predicted SAM-dependent methyltransferase
MLKKKLYTLFPFIPAANLFAGTKIYELKIRWNAQKTRNIFTGKTNLYVNIGCGSAGLTGDWVNVDYSWYKNVTCAFDCRKDVPFADHSVKGFFTEHFFEHLDYQAEVPEFLRNCWRVLQKDGVLRIIVPDAEKYLRGYCADGWEMLKQTRPLDEDLTDKLMGIQYQTKMQLVNETFRQGGEHKYAWDFETIKLVLTKAGFSDIHKMSYQQSHDPELAIDMEARRYESLYVEAVK